MFTHCHARDLYFAVITLRTTLKQSIVSFSVALSALYVVLLFVLIIHVFLIFLRHVGGARFAMYFSLHATLLRVCVSNPLHLTIVAQGPKP